MEFDPFDISMKYLITRNMITRWNSFGPLYNICLPTTCAPQASTYYTLTATATAASTSFWHRRLGHSGPDALLKLSSSSFIICNKHRDILVRYARQLAQHTRLPFNQQPSHATHYFDLIHCDLWTPPITCVSGSKYYLLILDDFLYYS
jgi:hypothetical protein